MKSTEIPRSHLFIAIICTSSTFRNTTGRKPRFISILSEIRSEDLDQSLHMAEDWECHILGNTLKTRFNEARFNDLRHKTLVRKMEIHFKKSQFSVLSQFKESKCADADYSLNRDLIVLIMLLNVK